MTASVFSTYQKQAWPIRFSGRLHVAHLQGGVPSDEKTARNWIKTKLSDTRSESEIKALVAQTMAERGMTLDEAVDEVALKQLAGVNGFKFDDSGLFIEGRQLKAAMKEAVSVAVAAGKIDLRGWGNTRKYLTSYFPEHVFVAEDKLHLHRGGEAVKEPSGTLQSFVHTWRGDAISYADYVTEVDIDFTVLTDHTFTKKDWAMLWLTGEKQGVGASRSQGFGQYQVTRWEQIAGSKDDTE